MDRVDAFAQRAREFITWAERETFAYPAIDAREALGLLVRLYESALELPEGEAADEQIESTSREEWKRVYSRAANLPFDHYWEIFDPLTESPDDAVCGSIGDDLADIHRDIKRGLQYYDIGDPAAAAWEWHLNFRAHWGHHASAAIYAFHAWWSEHYFEEVGG